MSVGDGANAAFTDVLGQPPLDHSVTLPSRQSLSAALAAALELEAQSSNHKRSPLADNFQLRCSNANIQVSDTRGYSDFAALLQGAYEAPAYDDKVQPAHYNSTRVHWDVHTGHRRWGPETHAGDQWRKSAPSAVGQTREASELGNTTCKSAEIADASHGENSAAGRFNPGRKLGMNWTLKSKAQEKSSEHPARKRPKKEYFPIKFKDDAGDDVEDMSKDILRACDRLQSMLRDGMNDEDPVTIGIGHSSSKFLKYSEAEVKAHLAIKQALRKDMGAIQRIYSSQYSDLFKLKSRLVTQSKQTDQLMRFSSAGHEADHGERILNTQLNISQLAAKAALGVCRLGQFRLFTYFHRKLKQEVKKHPRLQSGDTIAATAPSTQPEASDSDNEEPRKSVSLADAKRMKRLELLQTELEEGKAANAQAESKDEDALGKDILDARYVKSDSNDTEARVRHLKEQTLELKFSIQNKKKTAQSADCERMLHLIEAGQDNITRLLNQVQALEKQEEHATSDIQNAIRSELDDEVNQMVKSGNVPLSLLKATIDKDLKEGTMSEKEINEAENVALLRKLLRKQERLKQEQNKIVERIEMDAIKVASEAARERVARYLKEGVLGAEEAGPIAQAAAHHAEILAINLLRESNFRQAVMDSLGLDRDANHAAYKSEAFDLSEFLAELDAQLSDVEGGLWSGPEGSRIKREGASNRGRNKDSIGNGLDTLVNADGTVNPDGMANSEADPDDMMAQGIADENQKQRPSQATSPSHGENNNAQSGVGLAGADGDFIDGGNNATLGSSGGARRGIGSNLTVDGIEVGGSATSGAFGERDAALKGGGAHHGKNSDQAGLSHDGPGNTSASQTKLGEMTKDGQRIHAAAEGYQSPSEIDGGTRASARTSASAAGVEEGSSKVQQDRSELTQDDQDVMKADGAVAGAHVLGKGSSVKSKNTKQSNPSAAKTQNTYEPNSSALKNRPSPEHDASHSSIRSKEDIAANQFNNFSSRVNALYEELEDAKADAIHAGVNLADLGINHGPPPPSPKTATDRDSHQGRPSHQSRSKQARPARTRPEPSNAQHGRADPSNAKHGRGKLDQPNLGIGTDGAQAAAKSESGLRTNKGAVLASGVDKRTADKNAAKLKSQQDALSESAKRKEELMKHLQEKSAKLAEADQLAAELHDSAVKAGLKSPSNYVSARSAMDAAHLSTHNGDIKPNGSESHASVFASNGDVPTSTGEVSETGSSRNTHGRPKKPSEKPTSKTGGLLAKLKGGNVGDSNTEASSVADTSEPGKQNISLFGTILSDNHMDMCNRTGLDGNTLTSSKSRFKAKLDMTKMLKDLKKKVVQRTKVLLTYVPKEEAISAGIIPGVAMTGVQGNASMSLGAKKTNDSEDPVAKENDSLKSRIQNLGKLVNFWSNRIATAAAAKEDETKQEQHRQHNSSHVEDNEEDEDTFGSEALSELPNEGEQHQSRQSAKKQSVSPSSRVQRRTSIVNLSAPEAYRSADTDEDSSLRISSHGRHGIRGNPNKGQGRRGSVFDGTDSSGILGIGGPFNRGLSGRSGEVVDGSAVGHGVFHLDSGGFMIDGHGQGSTGKRAPEKRKSVFVPLLTKTRTIEMGLNGLVAQGSSAQGSSRTHETASEISINGDLSSPDDKADIDVSMKAILTSLELALQRDPQVEHILSYMDARDRKQAVLHFQRLALQPVAARNHSIKSLARGQLPTNSNMRRYIHQKPQAQGVKLLNAMVQLARRLAYIQEYQKDAPNSITIGQSSAFGRLNTNERGGSSSSGSLSSGSSSKGAEAEEVEEENETKASQKFQKAVGKMAAVARANFLVKVNANAKQRMLMHDQSEDIDKGPQGLSALVAEADQKNGQQPMAMQGLSTNNPRSLANFHAFANSIDEMKQTATARRGSASIDRESLLRRFSSLSGDVAESETEIPAWVRTLGGLPRQRSAPMLCRKRDVLISTGDIQRRRFQRRRSQVGPWTAKLEMTWKFEADAIRKHKMELWKQWQIERKREQVAAEALAKLRLGEEKTDDSQAFHLVKRKQHIAQLKRIGNLSLFTRGLENDVHSTVLSKLQGKPGGIEPIVDKTAENKQAWETLHSYKNSSRYNQMQRKHLRENLDMQSDRLALARHRQRRKQAMEAQLSDDEGSDKDAVGRKSPARRLDYIWHETEASQKTRESVQAPPAEILTSADRTEKTVPRKLKHESRTRKEVTATSLSPKNLNRRESPFDPIYQSVVGRGAKTVRKAKSDLRLSAEMRLSTEMRLSASSIPGDLASSGVQKAEGDTALSSWPLQRQREREKPPPIKTQKSMDIGGKLSSVDLNELALGFQDSPTSASQSSPRSVSKGKLLSPRKLRNEAKMKASMETALENSTKANRSHAKPVLIRVVSESDESLTSPALAEENSEKSSVVESAVTKLDIDCEDIPAQSKDIAEAAEKPASRGMTIEQKARLDAWTKWTKAKQKIYAVHAFGKTSDLNESTEEQDASNDELDEVSARVATPEESDAKAISRAVSRATSKASLALSRAGSRASTSHEDDIGKATTGAAGRKVKVKPQRFNPAGWARCHISSLHESANTEATELLRASPLPKTGELNALPLEDIEAHLKASLMLFNRKVMTGYTLQGGIDRLAETSSPTAQSLPQKRSNGFDPRMPQIPPVTNMSPMPPWPLHPRPPQMLPHSYEKIHRIQPPRSDYASFPKPVPPVGGLSGVLSSLRLPPIASDITPERSEAPPLKPSANPLHSEQASWRNSYRLPFTVSTDASQHEAQKCRDGHRDLNEQNLKKHIDSVPPTMTSESCSLAPKSASDVVALSQLMAGSARITYDGKFTTKFDSALRTPRSELASRPYENQQAQNQQRPTSTPPKQVDLEEERRSLQRYMQSFSREDLANKDTTLNAEKHKSPRVKVAGNIRKPPHTIGKLPETSGTRSTSKASGEMSFDEDIQGKSIVQQSYSFNPDTVKKVHSRLRAATYSLGSSDLKKFFDGVDKDKSGVLDLVELQQAFRAKLRISSNELSDQDIEHVFRMIDEDNSGSVTLDELEAFVSAKPDMSMIRVQRRPLPTPSPPQAIDMVSETSGERLEIKKRSPPSSPDESVDVQGKGFVQHDHSFNRDAVKKVRSRMQAATYSSGVSDVGKFFHGVDKDKSGVVDLGELQKAFRSKLRIPPSELSDQDIEQVFKLIDKDGSGSVTFDEIEAFIWEV